MTVSKSKIAPEALLDAATKQRKAATDAYERRQRNLARLAEQRDRGIWQGASVAAAVDQGRRDDALLRMNQFEFLRACGNAQDLPIDYHPILLPGRAPTDDVLAGAEGFLKKLRGREEETELWVEALRLEAQAYLAQLAGDKYLREAVRSADRYVKRLLAGADKAPPNNPDRLQAYAGGLRTYRRLFLPWKVEALYRQFLAGFGTPDPAGEMLAQLEADFDAVPRPVFQAWGYIADSVVPVLELRNPSDSRELEALIQLQTPQFAVVGGAAERTTVAVEGMAVEELARTGRSLKTILRTLAPDSRPVAVLSVFQGLAALGLSDYRSLFAITENLQPDEEALGVLLRALRGEARYRMGRYEDAYLDLLRAESRAVAALERRDADRNTWRPVERDGLARLAQKAGNALLAIGDERKADEAFARALEWLPDDPLLKAIDLINRGNLLFLRNALDRDQGYITVDRVLQKRMVDEGPAVLQAEKLRRHVESLGQAEKDYRAALALLPEQAAAHQALCHLNLGNLAWAWAKVVGAERAERLGALPGTAGLVSELISAESDERGCLRAAIGEYEAVVALTGNATRGEGRALLASALGNLSEVRYLAAGDDRASLRQALRDAEAALAKSRGRRQKPATAGGNGLPVSAATLHPELEWQSTLNVARIKQALGDANGAEAAYRQAIDVVEALRVGLRLDAWQALFLRDKMEAYECYLDFLFDHGGPDAANAMFDVIEKTRAHAFLDLLARARVGAALPAALRDAVDNLLGRIAAANEALRRATLGDDEKAAARLLRDQQRYALEWADLQAQMADAQGQDEQLNPRRIGLAETQARLGPERVLLLYQLGERASHLLAITAGAAHAFRLPSRRTIELATLPLLFDCSFGDDRAISRFREKGAALSRHLLGPLDAAGGASALLQDKHVLVAADGIMNYLPFETLFPDPAAIELLPPTATYADLKSLYLLSRSDVSYVPSASAWRELSERPRSAPVSSMLAVYDIRYDTGGLEPPLWAYPILMKLESVPGANDIRKAIEFVKTAWSGLDVVQIRGRRDDQTPEDPTRQPTEQNFLRIAPEAAARFVVFNGHAMYNDKHPNLSGLVFNLKPPSEPDAADIPSDNFLRVDELFRLELPGAEITFLAACQTALGAPYRGEGLNALLRAFMYRGSPAVVATLWAVDANAASWLLRRFFKLLAENPAADPARLFSQAKRTSIGFDNRWLPFHWAPFIYAGGTR